MRSMPVGQAAAVGVLAGALVGVGVADGAFTLQVNVQSLQYKRQDCTPLVVTSAVNIDEPVPTDRTTSL